MIAVQDSDCITAVRSLGCLDSQCSASYNLVQQALWPDTPFVNATAEASEEEPDETDHPGSWASADVSRSTAYLPQNGHMAHTMRVGQVLRPIPAPSSDSLKVNVKALVCLSTDHDPSMCIHLEGLNDYNAQTSSHAAR